MSSKLFQDISWNNLIPKLEYELLDQSHKDFASILIDLITFEKFIDILITLSNHTHDHLIIKYICLRIEDILSIQNETEFNELIGLQHKNIIANKYLIENLLTCLYVTDINLQYLVTTIVVYLYSFYNYDIKKIVEWISNKFISSVENNWEIALPVLVQVVHYRITRNLLIEDQAVVYVTSILKTLGQQGNSQQIYELCFVLWTLSLILSEDHGIDINLSNLKKFISTGIVGLINDYIIAGTSRKITRMCLAILKNLCVSENDIVLNEMYTFGISKTFDTMIGNHFIKQIGDDDAEHDFKSIADILKRNYRELSSYERWITQVNSGNLSWGILHTDKFWRENAKFMENDNFRELKTLLSLLKSDDSVFAYTLSTLYDIGEFSRFYPNGRVIVSKLGGKETIMKLMSSTTHDNLEHSEIQRHTLQCISKLLVTNWEFLR